MAAAGPDGLTEREYLRQFATRPGMFIGHTTLHGVTSFLHGYDQAARRHGGAGLTGFRQSLLDNHTGDSSLGWPALIVRIAVPDCTFDAPLTPAQELHALAVLFDLLDRFLAEREHTTQRKRAGSGR